MDVIKILTYFYNAGYNQGHDDTVEGCSTYCLPEDYTSLREDDVKNIIEEFIGNPESLSVFK